MKRFRVSDDFYLDEFLNKETYNTFGQKSIWFIDDRIITLAQWLRNHFGKPMVINNWATGGSYNNSGYRSPKSSVGSDYSQHRNGRAIDCKFEGLTPHEVFENVLANEKLFLDAGLTTIEDVKYTASWSHFDIRLTLDKSKILIVKP